jgi:hypothetical protein
MAPVKLVIIIIIIISYTYNPYRFLLYFFL